MRSWTEKSPSLNQAHTHKLYLTPVTCLTCGCVANSQRRVYSECSIFIPCHGEGRFRKEEKASGTKARAKSEDVLVWFGPEAETLPSSVVFLWIGHVCARTPAQWEIGLTRVALSCQAVRIVWYPLSPVGTRRAMTLHTENRWIDRLGPVGVLLVACLTWSVALIMGDWSLGTGKQFMLGLPLFHDGVVTMGRRSSDLLHTLTFKWND